MKHRMRGVHRIGILSMWQANAGQCVHHIFALKKILLFEACFLNLTVQQLF